MENFFKTQSEITNWLDEYNIENYIIIHDDKYGFIVNVDGDVNLVSYNLKKIPVKFNHIKGFFSCAHNVLESLEFAPILVDGDFICSHNKLTSLKYCPLIILDNFWCDNNEIKNLEYCPEDVGGQFYCKNNLFSEHIKSNDFKNIYKIHQEIKIIIAKEDLEKKLNKLNVELSVSKQNKI